jgi:aryl-alcohol dehydrogenase-like predicted oxidoreductase
MAVRLGVGGSIEGRSVGRVALGTASWALHEERLSRLKAARVMSAAVAHGITLVDTALAYTTAGDICSSERLVGAALADLGAQDSVVVATKGGHFRDGHDFPIDGRPETIRRHCELSLQALGLERIPLYQLHKPDPAVPLSETVGAFAALRSEGKIDLVGLSNVTVEQLEEARRIVEIASVQNRHELGSRDPMIERCTELGIAFLAYAPLRGSNSSTWRRNGAVTTVAAAHAVSPEQVVLAWHLAASPNVVTIVGARQPNTIEDSSRAAGLRLTPVEIDELSRHQL